MQKKIILYGLTAMLILAVALSGCGGGGGGGTTYTPGQKTPYSLEGVAFNMNYVPGGLTFPTDAEVNTFRDDATASVANAYWIAETEVTYELWKKIYDWAWADPDNPRKSGDPIGKKEYTFLAGHGLMGNGLVTTIQHPVTAVSWRGAIIWCNALTECYYGNSENCVYYSDENYTTPIRSINDARIDSPYIKAKTTGNTDMANCIAKGFRLPTSKEWELAARYHFKDGTNWIPGDHVSGDPTGPCYGSNTSTVYGNYAWYNTNSNESTQIVGTAGSLTPSIPKTGYANSLGLYDVSGNICEWCFDLYPDGEFVQGIYRGGSRYIYEIDLRLGDVNKAITMHSYDVIGFRLARSN